MSHNEIEIFDGALIISDAHYSLERPELLSLIEEIALGKITPSQLILMGDIFDTLFGGVSYTLEQNSEIIELLNKISVNIPTLYLEGNHDFLLNSVFKNIRVIPLSQQPLSCRYKDKKVSLAHGDFDVSLSYKIYSLIIRNSFTLKILQLINFLSNNSIVKRLDKHLAKKDDCQEFIGFKKYIQNRHLQRYESDIFIEGHYHQNNSFEFENFLYINLAAFACNQRYFIVKSSQDNKLFLEEKIYKEL